MALTLLVACGQASHVVAERTHIESEGPKHVESALFLPSTRAVYGGPDSPPTDWSSATTVTLPDVWGYLRPAAGNEVWYRILIDLSVGRSATGTEDAEPVWVLIERIRSSGQAFAGDRLIWAGGRMSHPVSRSGVEPYAFAVSHDLLAASGGQVLLRVKSAQGEHGGLGRILVGTHQQIHGPLTRIRFWNVQAVYITSAVIVATSFFILLLWWQISDGSVGYLALALAGFIWGIRNLNLVVIGLPPENPALASAWSFIATSGSGWVIGLLGLFLTHQFISQGAPVFARVLTWTILIHMVLGPILLLTPLPRAEALATWLALSVPVIALTLAGLIRFVAREPTLTHFGFLLFFVAVVGLNILDNFTLRSPSRFGAPYVSHFIGVAFFLMVAQILVARYGALMRAYQKLNASQEERLQEQQDQLTRQHTALVKLEAERIQAHERGRIMRDLHDGLGSQLTAALYQTRAEGAQHIELVLQECLEELRLAIYSLEPSSGYVATVLGTLRQRLTPALQAAGIQLIWDVQDVGQITALDSSRSLDLLRIVQEAISNAIKHARATEIRVGLTLNAGRIRIEVQDNGVGIGLDERTNGGHGIGNMHRRAGSLAATLRIESEGQGTRVTLDLSDLVQP